MEEKIAKEDARVEKIVEKAVHGNIGELKKEIKSALKAKNQFNITRKKLDYIQILIVCDLVIGIANLLYNLFS